VIDAYFEERAGAARSTGAAEFFDRQVQDEARQLNETQQALTDFQVQHHIGNLVDQKKLQITQIADLQAQMAAADAALARQRNKESAEKKYLSTIPERAPTMERTITNQYSQERLNTTLVELENRRTELQRLYPPTDRQVVEINEKIATTQRAIAAAAEHPAAESSSDVNPVWQQLRSQVANSSGDLSGMTAQRGQMQQDFRDAQARLKELEEATLPNDELERKLTQAQADYTLYAQKRDEARISEELDKEKMFDVSLVQAPVASPRPTRPKPLLYCAAGLAFALLLGTLLALYADTSGEQVFTPLQLDTLTGTRTMAVLADESDANQRQDQELGNGQLEFRRVLYGVRTALGKRLGSGVGTGLMTGHDAALAQDPTRPAGYCVGFTSALAGEGTTYVVDRLAAVAAKQGNIRVAVLNVEALLRRFEAKEDVSFALKYYPAKRFWSLAMEPNEIIETPLRAGVAQGQFSSRLSLLLIEGRREFDLIFLDCPSFRASTLAGELDRCVDGYVAVVAAGMARRQNIEQMEAVLQESHAPLLGYVLNRRRYPVPQWLHRMIW
jgi:succinoglycan biosynthesis transport protein ExoP